MDVMEIILLLVGGIVFAVSFLLPAGRKEDRKENRELVKEEIKGFVSEEMADVKRRMEDMAEETVEKTERSLERTSNEKIMAVSQYSETVLEDINKNHQEVMFLYDMLNDKHKNLKKMVTEVNQTVKEAENSVRKGLTQPSAADEKGGEERAEGNASPDADMVAEAEEQGGNSNEKILALYKEGMKKVDIAKELGLGVGEVKLVIDLYNKM